ncbi:hypothetical protein [Pelosinus sp. sgz500959]|uniref:hypothetical protein n=1 Tax=Pelosinus sp. sgz500959 TaxID=3242472 RepID=UPI00366E4B82
MTKKYIVEANAGFDNIRFSEPRGDVRAKIGDFQEFKKNRFSKNTTDDFGNYHAFYNQENMLEAVEFFEGEVYLDDKVLFPNTSEGLLTMLTNIDSQAYCTKDSVVSRKFGISAYAPEGRLATLLIHRPGYFD